MNSTLCLLTYYTAPTHKTYHNDAPRLLIDKYRYINTLEHSKSIGAEHWSMHMALQLMFEGSKSLSVADHAMLRWHRSLWPSSVPVNLSHTGCSATGILPEGKTKSQTQKINAYNKQPYKGNYCTGKRKKASKKLLTDKKKKGQWAYLAWEGGKVSAKEWAPPSDGILSICVSALRAIPKKTINRQNGKKH